MPLLLRLLDHDLHRARAGVQASPLILETPAKPTFVPAIVSTMDPGRFLISRRLTREGRIRSGVFSQDPDRCDDLVGPLVKAAYALSVEDSFPNRFGKAGEAFDYIQEQSGAKAHPHICLVPAGWIGDEVDSFFGQGDMSDSNVDIYRRICRVIPADVEFPVFFSRPDFVGMYTQFLGGKASLVLHNVRNGIAFVPPSANKASSRVKAKANVRRTVR